MTLMDVEAVENRIPQGQNIAETEKEQQTNISGWKQDAEEGRQR